MDKVKESAFLGAMIIISTVAVIITAAIVTIIIKGIGIDQTYIGKVILSVLSFGNGMCVIPYLMIKKRHKCKIDEIGLKKISIAESVIVTIIFVLSMVYLILTREKLAFNMFIIALIQNTIVAFSEELFSKGILYCSLRKIVSNKYLIVILHYS